MAMSLRSFQLPGRRRTSIAIIALCAAFSTIWLLARHSSIPLSLKGITIQNPFKPADVKVSQPQTCNLSEPVFTGVSPPKTVNVDALTSFWPELRTALETHGHDLPRLEKPPFKYSMPSETEIRERESLTDEQALLVRTRHAGYLAALPRYPDPPIFNGRGIVMLVGGRYSEYAVTALGVLRQTERNLPVEVWHRDARDAREGWCDELLEEGMVCRFLVDYLGSDLSNVNDPRAMKLLVMLFSSFEEIIFMDADNFAIQAPGLLFESEGYKKTGVTLWPDYWKYDNLDWLEYTVGRAAGRSEAMWNETTCESGQIVWDKRRNWDALLLVLYYNYYGPDFWYTMLNSNFAGWGDKDTFPLAMRALKKPYLFVPEASGWMGLNVKDRQRQVAQSQMAPTSKTVFFIHTTALKWSHRDFMCVECPVLWPTEEDSYTSRYEKPDEDNIYDLLHNATRLLAKEGLDWMPNGLDPELMIWRATEHAACRSEAWRHGRTCEATRKYIKEAFGFSFALEDRDGTFTALDDDRIPDMLERVCLVDPADVQH